MKLKPSLQLLLGLIWICAILGGTGAMVVYDNTPGQQSPAPALWPTQSTIPRAPGKPTLVMFAHPKCPCTSAALEELAQIQALCPAKAAVSVVFFVPQPAPPDWTHTDLWDQARAIDAVITRPDPAGRQAALFGAATSGHVVLYGADGKLLFSGAITPSRAHAGPNPGQSAIISALNNQPTDTHQTPVFGCPIFSRSSTCTHQETPCCH